MVRAFADTDRLLRFARENDLANDAGEESALILSIPNDRVVASLEQFIPHGVWFNSDTKSDGFFVPPETAPADQGAP